MNIDNGKPNLKPIDPSEYKRSNRSYDGVRINTKAGHITIGRLTLDRMAFVDEDNKAVLISEDNKSWFIAPAKKGDKYAIPVTFSNDKTKAGRVGVGRRLAEKMKQDLFNDLDKRKYLPLNDEAILAGGNMWYQIKRS